MVLAIGSYAALSQTVVIEAVPPEHAAAATGFHVFVISAEGRGGPPIFGAVVDATGSFSYGWLLLAVFCAASSIVSAIWVIHRPRQ